MTPRVRSTVVSGGLVITILAAVTVALWSTDALEISSAPKTSVRSAEQTVVAAGRGRVDIEGGLIQIAAQRDGVISAVFVTEGADVRAGDLLARQDDRAAQAALAEAKAALAETVARRAVLNVRLAASQRERNRLEGLRRIGAESAKLFDDAQSRLEEAMADIATHDAAVRLARARVATAEIEVEQREIRAPVDGRVVRVQARPGTGASTLSVSTLFTLVPQGKFVLRVDIEERFLRNIAIGQGASVTLEGDPAPSAGSVLRIGEILGQRKIDPAETQQRVDERVVEVVVSLPEQHYRIGQRGLAKFEALPGVGDILPADHGLSNGQTRDQG